jgi:hypothetical protein
MIASPAYLIPHKDASKEGHISQFGLLNDGKDGMRRSLERLHPPKGARNGGKVSQFGLPNYVKHDMRQSPFKRDNGIIVVCQTTLTGAGRR